MSRTALASLFSWAASGGASRRPATDGSVPGLDALATAVQSVLAPEVPSAAFREALRRDLAAIARQRKAPRVVLQWPRNHRRGILIGAAVSSAVSVAGLIAIIWRRHSQVAERAM